MVLDLTQWRALLYEVQLSPSFSLLMLSLYFSPFFYHTRKYRKHVNKDRRNIGGEGAKLIENGGEGNQNEQHEMEDNENKG